MANPFSPLDVLLRASTRWRAIELHVELTSTNDVLRARAERGEPDGLVVVADHQSEGHGRRHPWVDRPGGALLTSFLVRMPARVAPAVSFAAGLALDDAIGTLCDDRELVWPNRVEIGGRAVGGVLVDMGGRDPRWFVIGVGVNVASGPDLEAGWIALEEVQPTDRFDLLSALMHHLERRLQAAEDTPDRLAAAYRERCATLGREVTIGTLSGDERTGVASDVDDRGALLLDDGTEVVRILAGEILEQRPVRPA